MPTTPRPAGTTLAGTAERAGSVEPETVASKMRGSRYDASVLLRVSDNGEATNNGGRSLNLGSGSNARPGAVNVDIKPGAGVDVVADAGQLPFKSGAFGEVSSVNPHGFQPVSAETARVLSPGGTLRVTAGPRNPFGSVSAAEAKAAGFELVSAGPSSAADLAGNMTTVSGNPITNTSGYTTYVYRRVG
jgi:hypothetical protein